MEDAAKRIDVGRLSSGQVASPPAFRWTVGRRAEASVVGLNPDHLRASKVDDFERSVGAHEDVVRLHVEVNEPGAMNGRKTLGYVGHNRENHRPGQVCRKNHIRQKFSVEHFRNKVRNPIVYKSLLGEAKDARVIYAVRVVELSDESLNDVRIDHVLFPENLDGQVRPLSVSVNDGRGAF